MFFLVGRVEDVLMWHNEWGQEIYFQPGRSMSLSFSCVWQCCPLSPDAVATAHTLESKFRQASNHLEARSHVCYDE